MLSLLLAAALLPYPTQGQEEEVTCPARYSRFPSADGTCNHHENPSHGKFEHLLSRYDVSGQYQLRANYRDGRETPDTNNRPSARLISNRIVDQSGAPHGNPKGSSLLLIFFGQFIDHDFALTHECVQCPREDMNIVIPPDDLTFTEEHMEFTRSTFERSPLFNNREFPNANTAYFDLSNIYGSVLERARLLRQLKDGLMRVRGEPPNEYLPHNKDLPGGGVPTSGNRDDVVACGDERCNENMILLAITTLWVREHNRLAREMWAPGKSDEQIYQEARLRNIMNYQRIIFTEYLPILLGRSNLQDPSIYPPFDPSNDFEKVDPNMNVLFNTCAYRYGHSGVAEFIPFMDIFGGKRGEVKLAQTFFENSQLNFRDLMIDFLFNGLRFTEHEFLDEKIVDALRNSLFANIESRLDLAALNIQRGRDHGLYGFSAYRGCDPELTDCFKDLTGELELSEKLREVYNGDYHAVDCWVGGLAEKKNYGDSQLGETFTKIILEQFVRLRDGDRFWYERLVARAPQYFADFSRNVVYFADVISRNTQVGPRMNPPAFYTKHFFVSGKDHDWIQVEWTGWTKLSDGAEAFEVQNVVSYEIYIQGGDVRQNRRLGPSSRYVRFTNLPSDTDFTLAQVINFEIDGQTRRRVTSVKGRTLTKVNAERSGGHI